MRENSITLKSTPSGRAFMQFIAMLNTGDEERLSEFIGKRFSAEVLADYSVDELVTYCMTVYNETGGMRIHKVFLSQEFTMMVVMKAIRDDVEVLFLDRLKVETVQPHNILEYVHQEFNAADYGG
ncbi:MAG: hypothetical protein RLP44_16445 [Aggregatilineales bacterium]